MKKINYILFAIAFLALLPAKNVQAQTETTYKDGLGYSKNISTPNDKGVYTITLEAFTTGTVTVTQKSVPADIVLVLDVSGSMNGAFGDDYTALESDSYSYNDYDDVTYYYQHNGQYYEVHRERPYEWVGYQNQRRHRLYYQVGNTTYYLSGTGVTTTAPTNVTNANTTIWTGVLYRPANRLDALKTAVNNFIDVINANDLYFNGEDGRPDETQPRDDRLGNRIAIVTYSTNANNRTNGLMVLGENKTDDSGVVTLKGIVNGLNADGGTYSHRGMEIASGIITGLNDTRQLRTTVFFTDGNPGLNGSWTNTQTVNNNDRAWGAVSQREDAFLTANATINYANQIKGTADDTKKIISNVYTVSVIEDPMNQTVVYLGKTSSDWIGADNMGWYNDNWNTLANCWNYNHNGSVGSRNTSSTDFSLESTSPDSLKDIFETIAGESGGSDADLGGSTVAVLDIVSQNFMLPEGALTSDIKVYTAPCNGGSEGALEFGTPVLAKNNTARYHKITRNPDGTITWSEEDYDIDNDIQVNFVGNNMVQVTGFDYASNFCGFDENNQPRGYEVLIEIPVVMNPDAVGGPNSESNEPGSGIYADLDGDGSLDPIITYDPPKVDLPTNIFIEKEGLNKGESAKFRIERIHKSNPGSTAWEPVTTVFLTNTVGEGNKPMVKIRGLDPNYIYQVVEEPWSWAYTSEAITPTRTDQLIKNPFQFKNIPKTNIDKQIRHAESKATNDFIGSGSVEYVDSKPRTTSSTTTP